jgi:transcriptional regulator with XRE-family HTH domain
MGNDRLRGTLRTSGYSEADFAGELGVDPKTVQRWISQGRTPHPQTAGRASKLLGVPASWLWPSLEASELANSAREVAGFYPHRAAMPKALWLDAIIAARQQIDLITYASLFLPEDNPDSVALIRHKAEQGVAVRIALGDPDSPEIELRDREERMSGGIQGRIRMALAYYRPLVGVLGIDFRLHRTTLYNSIFRFDDQIFVNQHIYGIYGYLAPILHLREVQGSDLFATYTRSTDLIWEAAYALPEKYS